MKTGMGSARIDTFTHPQLANPTQTLKKSVLHYLIYPRNGERDKTVQWIIDDFRFATAKHNTKVRQPHQVRYVRIDKIEGSAQYWIRTSTTLRLPPPQDGVSTNFTNWAYNKTWNGAAKIRI